jgi:hypothetical protein
MAHHKYYWLLVLGLTVIAALPRFYQLGVLSFYGDEETNSFPALSFAQGNGAKMPSGMSYRRALPHTWLTALSAKVFGTDREFSYRIPAAMFGTLSIPLLFILARPFIGWQAALVAATLLAFSEWHISTSREARMYAPFIFLFIACSFTIWRWAITDSWLYLVTAFLLFVLTVSFHTLAMFASILPIIAIFINGWAKTSSYRMVLFSVLSAATAWLYSSYVVQGAFDQWIASSDISSSHDGGSTNQYLNVILSLPAGALTAGLAGAGIGIWAAYASRPENSSDGASLRELGRYMLGAVMGGLAFSGQLYGAGVAGFLFLLIYSQSFAVTLRRIRLPAGILLVGVVYQASISIVHHGLIDGTKEMLMFPFPYLFFLAELIPGVLVLFLGMGLYLLAVPQRTDERFIRACILAAFAPIIALGLVSKWEGMRYLIEAYPFILLVAAAALVKLCRILVRKIGLSGDLLAVSVAVAIAASGLLGGHGIPQALKIATLEHGDYTAASSYPLYPDHQAPGRYVKQHRNTSDVVVAEDALQQKWYTGHVDYWLRDYDEHRGYLYRSEDGSLRDIYVNSRLATIDILEDLPGSGCRYIWLITSGEMAHKLDYYLDRLQLAWRKSIEASQEPVFVGRDGVTKVFRLECRTEKGKDLNDR